MGEGGTLWLTSRVRLALGRSGTALVALPEVRIPHHPELSPLLKWETVWGCGAGGGLSESEALLVE